MTDYSSNIHKTGPVVFSAPCRIDIGGTLDISSMYYPMARLGPCTFNIALDLRTTLTLCPCEPGRVLVSSKGFESAGFSCEKAPFDHELGLIFAIASCFGAEGVHVDIRSQSPPRSALGGSSVAAVALVAALMHLSNDKAGPKPCPSTIAVLAHGIEQGTAGVVCGMQDHLAAAYGGINVWHWKQDQGRLAWTRKALAFEENDSGLDSQILVAYCGVPHESKDVNGTWIRRFIRGLDRPEWRQIVENTREFVQAFEKRDLAAAIAAMNRETEIRRRITPDVVDDVGAALLKAAMQENCGARFAGAGGGGCLWALGTKESIRCLKPRWEEIVAMHPDGEVLDAGIDWKGVCQDP